MKSTLQVLANSTLCGCRLLKHTIALPQCCPVSKNPFPSSWITIAYQPGQYVLEVASISAYIAAFQGGLRQDNGELDLRDMEGMIQRIADDFAVILQVDVKVYARLILRPHQVMRGVFSSTYDLSPLRRSLDLIYCAGDNEKLTRIASDLGFMIGIRTGRTSHGFPVEFVDVEYKRPNFEKHLSCVKRHGPKYATVPDLSYGQICEQDIERALRQYDQLKDYCEVPLIVPKVPGQIALLPAHVAIGYSIPTSYGGAHFPLWELEGRRVHLLGGSPHEQMEVYKLLSTCAQVMSVDGNMAQKMAISFAKIWEDGVWFPHPERGTDTPDLYLDCWQRSCENIRQAWGRLAYLQPRQLMLVE